MTEEMDKDASTWPAQLTSKVHRKLYPFLDPSNPFLSAAGKTVLVTGVSGGIGAAIAEAWTIAGAKGIVITGRNVDALEEVRKKLETIGQGKVKIIVASADVTKEEDVKKLWQVAGEQVGCIDVLINVAGSLTPSKIGEGEPAAWWKDFEINIKGVYLNVHHFLAQAQDGTGTVITLSTGALGDIYPDFSSYIPSKLASTKFMEFLHAEQPQVRTFSLFPGVVATQMPPKQYLDFAQDDAMLSGGLSLFLCTERAEWLRGCMVSVNWDYEEMEQHKGEILEEGLIRLKFAGARFGKGGHPWRT